MKKTWITAVAVLTLGASLAFAAPHDGEGKGWGGHRRHRGAFGAKFAEKLNLTDAQKQQIRDLNQTFRAENKAFFQTFRQNMRDLREAKKAGDTAKADALKATLQSQRAQMKSLHEGLQQRVGTVLTPDQLSQWNAMKAEREARHQQRMEHRRK